MVGVDVVAATVGVDTGCLGGGVHVDSVIMLC
jgi:hypothetical protein